MSASNGKMAILGGVFLLVASNVAQANMVISDPTLSIGDAYFVGYIDDGIPSNLSDEAGYINTLITLAAGTGPVAIGTETYDRTLSSLAGPFDSATTTDADKDETASNTTTLTDSFQYILGKYDGPNFGSLVWYHEEGFTGDITLPATAGPVGGQQYGISHISWFNKVDTDVPAPATLLLFGIGLLGLGLRARRRSA